MERKDNQVFFTAAEHKKFGVAEVVTLDSAIETAESFIAATSNMAVRTQDPGDSTNRHQQAERQQLIKRAGELRGFAHGILSLCADRIIERDLGLSRKLN